MGEKEAIRLLELLNDNSIEYKIFEHEPVYTSEQASKVRGVDLKTGVKAMVLKIKLQNKEQSVKEDQVALFQNSSSFILADVAANRRLDFKKIENLVSQEEEKPIKKLEFAKKDEVLGVTGCEAGSVHPIGRLFKLETYLDESVLENDFLNFNIGLLTKSITIRKQDFLKILNPKTISIFSKS